MIETSDCGCCKGDCNSPVYDDISAERRKQKEKWDAQEHPMRALNVGGHPIPANHRLYDRLEYYRSVPGVHGWYDILMEEVCEAFLEKYLNKQREGFVRVAAVAVQIIEKIDEELAR